jgi:hypothetical protein
MEKTQAYMNLLTFLKAKRKEERQLRIIISLLRRIETHLLIQESQARPEETPL